MPKKKKEHSDNARTYGFQGGPRDGMSLRMIHPPVSQVRLAFPEWCTYEWSEETQTYQFVSAESLPK